MIVKVCGMTQAENIRTVEALGPDMMGFIFYEKSPRKVVSMPSHMPLNAARVGVFVNHDEDFIMDKVALYGFSHVQLHGQETPLLCSALRAEGLKVMKAFSIAGAEDMARTKDYLDCCDLFVFDTKTSSVGGSGRSFDWSLLELYDGPVPFLLSGGIGPDTELGQVSHPYLAGFDLNSRFETQPGVKDPGMLKETIDKIRKI
ncbi:MAG: phosphoribosylanthranilate isomerase [Bacteroidales bacterium]|nr:phosphoribosylanthranilate isomerase [Bacteroidales bacterium]